MEEILKKFKSQFNFCPEIKNSHNFKIKNELLVIGMGGSHLSADLLKISHPLLKLIVHNDFNIPQFINLAQKTIILVSYSGNTLEVINIFQQLKRKKIIPLIISANGFLLSQAKLLNYPYIELPEEKIPPRLATGYLYISLLKAINDNQSLNKIKKLSQTISVRRFKNHALKLSLKLKGKIPIIYSSLKNFPLAYNFKIRFNETSKIPAFCNYFPELNHNEIQGFYRIRKNFLFLILKDLQDSKEILKTIEIFEKFMKNNNFLIENLLIEGKNVFEKIFFAIHLADWLSFYLAKINQVDPINTPFIEEIKKREQNEFFIS